MTLPHLDGDSSPEQTGRGNGPTILEAPVLSTAKTMELPDERQILPSRLATAAAADYPSYAPPLSLSDSQMANRIGTS